MRHKISGAKIEILRGRLIARLERDVHWREFARLCNVRTNTIGNLRAGRTGGTIETCDKIVSGMRRQGLDVGRDDVLT